VENGKVNEMPCHHKLEQYPDAYIKVVGIDEDPRGRCSVPQLEKPRRSGWGRCRGRMSGIWCAAGLTTQGIETAIGCHTFRATGITDYLTNGGRIEVAQRMAAHSNAETTGSTTGGMMMLASAKSRG
jgi:integrase/recombinase XerD